MIDIKLRDFVFPSHKGPTLETFDFTFYFRSTPTFTSIHSNFILVPYWSTYSVEYCELFDGNVQEKLLYAHDITTSKRVKIKSNKMASSRFASVDEDNIAKLTQEKDSKNTKKAS